MRGALTFLLILVLQSTLSIAVDPVAEQIRQQLEAAGQPAILSLAGEMVHASLALPGFYEHRGFQPAWSNMGYLKPLGRELIDAIKGTEAEGLRPPDYHLAALETLFAEDLSSPARLAEVDLLLTDAFLILGAHLVGGRVDPVTFDHDWIATRREVDVAEQLELGLQNDKVQERLLSLRPRHKQYAQLVAALARYRTMASAGEWPTIGHGPSLKPGAVDARVPKLRRRLAATRDIEPMSPEDSELYDEYLVHGLTRFQHRHGLAEDGIVGEKTIEALDVTAASRSRQIELNLERWRWLPQTLGERYLLVNIPEFRLRVLESGDEVLNMRVIVGRTARRTPVFSDLMRYLVFSPSWEVPPTILRRDKLPLIRGNNNYPIEQNMQVFLRRDQRWQEEDPRAIDWTGVTPNMVRLVQRPGANNALGRVKFMFPNPFDVYLHDTPERELFGRAQRDFSSGCIRLERPADLALYLLQDDGWEIDSVRGAMDSGRERTVTLRRPIPIHIQYWTAWIGNDGRVEFRPDVYGRDARLDAALRQPPPTDHTQ